MRSLLFASLLIFASVCAAADRQLVLTPSGKAPGGEKRLALVIGNAAYASAPLRNPVNDARAIARALASTGFKVTVLEDATQATMVRAVRQFGDELLGGGVGLFYYAGHGMQVRGRNYLIPVNADIQREDEIEFNAVDANFVVAKMDTAKNGLNLLILDACRNNPFTRAFRSGSQGLAQMDAPSGTLVAFATAPGQVAADGDGSNGLYTKHLLANLAKPGLPIEQLFKEVRNGVAKETSERQIPWESSSLRGNFFFVAPDPSQSPEAQKAAMQRAIDEAVKREQDKLAAERAAEQKKTEDTIRQLLANQRAELEEEMRRRGEMLAAAAPKPAPVPAPAAPALNPEMAFWDSIKSSTNAEDYRAYLSKYPQGTFAALARARANPPPKPAVVAAPQPQLASIAPAALIGTGIDDPKYPRIGDRWEYSYTDSFGRKHKRLRFEVTGVSREGILESGGFADVPPAARAHGAALGFVYEDYFNLSPYLLSFGIKSGTELEHLTALRYLVCQRVSAVCRYAGKVVGQERITTPAGTFDALKIVVDLNAQGVMPFGGTSNQTWRQMTFWYSESAKRVIKSIVSTRTGYVIDDDYVIELVSYKLN